MILQRVKGLQREVILALEIAPEIGYFHVPGNLIFVDTTESFKNGPRNAFHLAAIKKSEFSEDFNDGNRNPITKKDYRWIILCAISTKFERLGKNVSTVHDFWPQWSRKGTTSRKLWLNQARITTGREYRSIHHMARERSASAAEITVFSASE
ncbi:hypothetical protein TNCV_2970411 [Trichonephila clavipes]|nr:hypothetical protein TNCV_2970411 [Trichonephila clavipes]